MVCIPLSFNINMLELRLLFHSEFEDSIICKAFPMDSYRIFSLSNSLEQIEIFGFPWISIIVPYIRQFWDRWTVWCLVTKSNKVARICWPICAVIIHGLYFVPHMYTPRSKGGDTMWIGFLVAITAHERSSSTTKFNRNFKWKCP